MLSNTTPQMDQSQTVKDSELHILSSGWSASISMREEILLITHKWPQIVLFCIVGCLLGYIISQLWPARYQATTDIYVGLNIFEVQSDQPVSEYAGQQFKDFIDYKNWQMMNLSGFIFMDQVLDDTLVHLRALDSHWVNVNRIQLRDMLRAYWRSAGKWRLVAQNQVPLHAIQAAFTWQTTILQYTQEAILASRSLQDLLPQRQENATALTQLTTSNVSLLQVKSTLQEQTKKIQQLPQNQTLNQLDRWLVWQTIVQADLGPTWLPLIEAFPELTEPASSYVDWLEKAAQALDGQLQVIQHQIADLETEKKQLETQYSQALIKSRGLSANLEIQAIHNPTVQELQLCSSEITNCDLLDNGRFISTLRPAGLFILVGGFLGLLGWLSFWIIRLAR